MEAIAWIAFVLMAVGGFLFLGWLVSKFPPPDIDNELKLMRAEKEAEYQRYIIELKRNNK